MQPSQRALASNGLVAGMTKAGAGGRRSVRSIGTSLYIRTTTGSAWHRPTGAHEEGMDSDSVDGLLKARRRAPAQAKQASKGSQRQHAGSDSDSDGFDIVAAARQSRSPGKTGGEPAAAKPRAQQQQVALHVRAGSADASLRAAATTPTRSPLAAGPPATSSSSSELDLISAARNSRSGRPSVAGFAAEVSARPASAGRHAAKPVRPAGGAQEAVPISRPPPPIDAGSDSDSGFDLVAAARQGRSPGKATLPAAGSPSEPVRSQQQAGPASKASSASGAGTAATAQHVRSSSVPYAPAAEQPPAVALPTASSAPLLPLPSVPAPKTQGSVQFPLPAQQPPVTIMAEPELLTSGSAVAEQAAPAPPTAAPAPHSSRSMLGAALPVASEGSAGQVVRSSTGDRAPVEQPPASAAHSTGTQGLEGLPGRTSPAMPPFGQANTPHPAPATPQQQQHQQQQQQVVVEDRVGPAPVSPAVADSKQMAAAALREAAACNQGSPGQAGLTASRRDSLTAFGDVVQQSVAGAVSDLRSDIQQLEARWSSRWQEQSAATEELNGKVEVGGKEVNSRLDGIVAELAAQKQRLEVVERAQACSPVPSTRGLPPPASPAKLEADPAAVVNNPIFDSQQARSAQTSPPVECAAAASPPASPSASPSASSGNGNVEAIMQRLDLLERRVQSQLTHLECQLGSSSPRGAEGSPSPRRAATPATQSPSPRVVRDAARTGSPAPQAWAAPVPVHAAAAGVCTAASGAEPAAGQYYQQLFSGIGAAGVVYSRPPSVVAPAPPAARPAFGSPSSSSRLGSYSSSPCSARVDRQVAETHAIIQGIQEQIAHIKHGLAASSAEMGRSKLEQGTVSRRLEQLEQRQHILQGIDTYKAILGQTNAQQHSALKKRVEGLESKVASLQYQVGSSDDRASDLALRMSGLEWRFDKSSEATINTLRAVEGKQDKLRVQLAGVRDSAIAAEARSAAAAGEVERLGRKVNASPSRPLFRNY